MQRIEDRKFNRNLRVSFSLLFFVVISLVVFYTFQGVTRLLYHQWAWYGKKIPEEWACMDDNHLKIQKANKYSYNEKFYSFCSEKAFSYLQQHFKEVAIVPDAFSGDSINKADAL